MTVEQYVTHVELEPTYFEEGDAAVYLKLDGTFRIATCDKNVDPKNLTHRQLEQGRALMAFAFLLKTPDCMKVVVNLAFDGQSAQLAPLQ